MIAVIGYGNPLRRDDGAGPRLAALVVGALENAGEPVCDWSAHQLTPELAFDLSSPEIGGALFCDTRVFDGDSDARLCRIGPRCAASNIGHQFNPESVLSLVKEVYGRDVCGWLASVPGWDFGFGESLSPGTQAALHHVPLEEWIGLLIQRPC